MEPCRKLSSLHRIRGKRNQSRSRHRQQGSGKSALWKSKTEEYKVNEYPDRYDSRSRIAKTGGEDYVNIQSQTDQRKDSTVTPQQPRVEQYRTERSTTARSIEEIDTVNKKRLARENRHDFHADIHRGVLLEYITDFAGEFNDQAPLTSSTTRAYHLFRQSGLTLDAFTTYLYTARAVTKERTGSIRKYTETGAKTKMAYFFAVLEDRLGIRGQGRGHLRSSTG